jgi:hypothetical protein
MTGGQPAGLGTACSASLSADADAAGELGWLVAVDSSIKRTR